MAGPDAAVVTRYLAEIDNLAKAYNENPIPLWLVDALGGELRKITTASNNHIYSAKFDFGANLPTVTEMIEIHNTVYALNDESAFDSRLDKTMLATWWTLKNRQTQFSALTFPLDDAAWVTTNAMAQAAANDDFCTAVHDAWAFSRVYTLIPCYMTINNTSGYFLKAYLIDKTDNPSGINGPGLFAPGTSTDKPGKNLIEINNHLFRKDQHELMVPYANLSLDQRTKDGSIGASVMRMILKMESLSYPPLSKTINLPDLFQPADSAAAGGGAPTKKKKKPTASAAVKAKLTAAKKKTKPASA